MASSAPPAALRISFSASAGGYAFRQLQHMPPREQQPAPQRPRQMPGKAERDALFKRMDPNGNGQLSMGEFTAGLLKLLPQFDNKRASRRAFLTADRDGSGFISRREFRLLLHYTLFFHEKAASFHRIDADGDGRVDLGEFIRASREVGSGADEAQLQREFAILDADRGGYIRFSEFCSWAARREAVAQGLGELPTPQAQQPAAAAAARRPPKVLTGEQAMFRQRRRLDRRRRVRDARHLRRQERGADQSWLVQARRALCSHSNAAYRDLRMHEAGGQLKKEGEWVEERRVEAARHLAEESLLSEHQAGDLYQRTVSQDARMLTSN